MIVELHTLSESKHAKYGYTYQTGRNWDQRDYPDHVFTKKLKLPRDSLAPVTNSSSVDQRIACQLPEQLKAQFPTENSLSGLKGPWLSDLTITLSHPWQGPDISPGSSSATLVFPGIRLVTLSLGHFLGSPDEFLLMCRLRLSGTQISLMLNLLLLLVLSISNFRLMIHAHVLRKALKGDKILKERVALRSNLEVIGMIPGTSLIQGRKRTRTVLKGTSSSKISAKKTRVVTLPLSVPLKVKNVINKHFYSRIAELRMVELIDKPRKLETVQGDGVVFGNGLCGTIPLC
ncbi:hypothetical protein M9H77_08971 [Catharanthus roseus]|uniref:Uncharacterized protein n=1 Tax=Catharanthus roseus TaxID=4058 RepID=A0ACC0BZG4_CATRO|nr:hypothetical protein M9H77_08971 [Catharanthus roseus]